MTPGDKIIELIEQTEAECREDGCLESESCQRVIEGMVLAAFAVSDC